MQCARWNKFHLWILLYVWHINIQTSVVGNVAGQFMWYNETCDKRHVKMKLNVSYYPRLRIES